MRCRWAVLILYAVLGNEVFVLPTEIILLG